MTLRVLFVCGRFYLTFFYLPIGLVWGCGGFRDVEGRFFLGIGELRDVGGVVAYGIWVWWCIGFFGTWRVNLPYHMDCRIAGRRGRRPLRCLRFGVLSPRWIFGVEGFVAYGFEV